jgi:hypothetical protein
LDNKRWDNKRWDNKRWDNKRWDNKRSGIAVNHQDSVVMEARPPQQVHPVPGRN